MSSTTSLLNLYLLLLTETQVSECSDSKPYSVSSYSKTKFICSVCLSPNSTDYPKYFGYLNSKIEHILSSSLSEIIILDDFNAQHRQRLSSSSHDPAGELAYQFSIQSNLEQLVHLPTRITDRLGDEPNILDLFLTSYPSPFTVKFFPHLGSSHHLLISVSCSISSSLPQERPRFRRGDVSGILVPLTGLTCG